MEIKLDGTLVHIPTGLTINDNYYQKEMMEKAIEDYIYKKKIEDRLNKIKKLKNGRISKM